MVVATIRINKAVISDFGYTQDKVLKRSETIVMKAAISIVFKAFTGRSFSPEN
jgi:hypothetical protein